jgi:thiol-disulfide isomerase/thioredoxin
MNRTHILGGLLLAVIILCAAALTYWYLSIPSDSKGSDAGAGLNSETPGVFLNLAGEEVSFEAHVGKVRVVTSWASWNPFSVTDLQTFDTVASEYKDSGVVFLAINRKETKEQAERFLSTLPQLSHIEFAIDTQDTFYIAIDGYAMPETVIYDDRGTIVFHTHGITTETELKNAIDALLQQE